MNLFPLASFDVIDDDRADVALVAWGHYLGACHRPYARQSFGLFVADELISVAVSASTVGRTCAGFRRRQVVELVRLVTAPCARWATRVTLRLWRQIAPTCWARRYRNWQVCAVVSYSNETRHTGDIYRFDGWRKVGVVRGSTGGGHHSRTQPREDKAIWIFELTAA